MGTPVGSATLDHEVVKFFEELVEFYGHGSPQARIIERVKRRLELVPVGDKYERLCPTCKCPVCGKTRSQAAAIARERQRRGKDKYLAYKYPGMGMELSQPDDDIPVRSVGFSVLDIGKAEADAIAYIIGTEPSKRGK